MSKAKGSLLQNLQMALLILEKSRQHRKMKVHLLIRSLRRHSKRMKVKNIFFFVLTLLIFFQFVDAHAYPKENYLTDAFQSTLSSANKIDENAQFNFLSFKHQLKIIAFLFFLSLLPFAVMMLTSFTRITIIFHFLRQALGSPQVPSNQIV